MVFFSLKSGKYSFSDYCNFDCFNVWSRRTKWSLSLGYNKSKDSKSINKMSLKLCWSLCVDGFTFVNDL